MNSFFSSIIGGALLSFVIMIIIWSVVIMLLWNWLMPDLFGVPEVTFWQALGIRVLSSALFSQSYTVKNQNND